MKLLTPFLCPCLFSISLALSFSLHPRDDQIFPVSYTTPRLNKKVGFPQDLAPLCFLQSRAFEAHLLLPANCANCYCTRVFQGKNHLSSPFH